MEEVEVVDKDVEPPERNVEEVDDSEKDATVEQEVSTDCPLPAKSARERGQSSSTHSQSLAPSTPVLQSHSCHQQSPHGQGAPVIIYSAFSVL